ncbi:TonB-dependent receptor domain-containing protein [Bowmanella pacifica]|nr:TonB-dependent receptor [Bowmanella pacifica]
MAKSWQAFAQTLYFDLPADTLPQTLMRLAEQADLQVSIAPSLPLGHSPSIQGHYTVQTILERLLTDSGLRFEISQGNILVFADESIPAVDTQQSWNHILVTGQNAQRRSVLDSSLSVTYLSRDTLQLLAPASTAELLQQTTGFWVEDSGGEANNNVAPRGLRGGEGFRFISLMEDGLPVVYDGVWSDFFVRQDLMTQGVETIRGGSSGIFTLNGPAAMVNLLGVRGGSNHAGNLVFRQGLDHGYSRLDLRFDGPLDGDWHYAVGGFYRVAQGVRDPGFDTDRGGQVSARLSLLQDVQSLELVFKHLNDNTSFFAPLPMQNFDSPVGVEGIDATHSTMLSDDLRHLRFETPAGTVSHDLADGQLTKMNSVGVYYERALSGGLTVNNRLRFADLYNSLYTVMNLGNDTLLNAETLLDSPELQRFLATVPQATGVAYRYVASHEWVENPALINANGLVTFSYPLYSQYDARQWLNHASLDYQWQDHSLTAGHIFAQSRFDALPLDQWQGKVLTDVRHRPRRLDIVAVDADGAPQASFTAQGLWDYAGPAYLQGKGKLTSHSVYANLEYQWHEDWVWDLGARHEWLSLEADAYTDKVFDLPSGKLSRYVSGHQFSRQAEYQRSAWSLGVNHKLSDWSATFIRLASAFEMPRLLSFGNQLGWGDYESSIPEGLGFGRPIKLQFVEWGVRMADARWSLAATLFQTRFNPLNFTVYRGVEHEQQTVMIDTRTHGLEFELGYRASSAWQVDLLGVWQQARFDGIPQILPEHRYNGNQVTRTPALQLRFIPRYRWDEIEAYAVWSYVGHRYSDVANDFALAAYQKLDVGVSWQLMPALKLSLAAKNLTNTLGLTEGNPRDDLNQRDSEYFYARPIFGRHVSLALDWHF